MDLIDAADLTLAYIRRKRFEAKLLARELAEMMAPGMMMTTGAGNGRFSHTGQHSGGQRVHADQLLSDMGITIQ